MALDLTAYKASLKTAAQTKQSALVSAAADDPKKLARIAELNVKWQGLKDQEAEIGALLVKDTSYKADDALLTEIDALKTKVSAELVSLGQVKPT